MAESPITSPAEAPLYIEFTGQKYVRLDHAIEVIGASAKDALEAAAVLIRGYSSINTTIAAQAANDIRSLKIVIKSALQHPDDWRHARGCPNSD